METELRARAEADRDKRPWAYYRLDREVLIRLLDEQADKLALLQPTNPAYDSPEGWWLRLSGEQRAYLYKRYLEMGDTCSSVPGSGADEHATVEPVAVDGTWPDPEPWKGEWTEHHVTALGRSAVVRSVLRGDSKVTLNTFKVLDSLMSEAIGRGYEVAGTPLGDTSPPRGGRGHEGEKWSSVGPYDERCPTCGKHRCPPPRDESE